MLSKQFFFSTHRFLETAVCPMTRSRVYNIHKYKYGMPMRMSKRKKTTIHYTVLGKLLFIFYFLVNGDENGFAVSRIILLHNVHNNNI